MAALVNPATVDVSDRLVLQPAPKPPVWRCYYPNCRHVVNSQRAAAQTQAVVDHLLWHWRLAGDFWRDALIDGVYVAGGGQ
jgi:hypothetical protein